jgi:uncharacterized coiled-coil DUF342 family protein
MSSLSERLSNVKSPESSAARVAEAQDKAEAYTEVWRKALEESEACKKLEAQLTDELTQLKSNADATPEQINQTRAKLATARENSKVAHKVLRKAHEKAAEENKRADNVKKQEKSKVMVVDGYVVDDAGNKIRPYGSFERFVDNKLLSFGLLGLAIVLMLAATWVMATIQH